MKTVILNKFDKLGGASIAAYRLHLELKKIGIYSMMLVDKKLSDDSLVYGPDSFISKMSSKLRPHFDNFPLKFYNRKKTVFNTGLFGKAVTKEYIIAKTDVINLHWITGGFISIKEISKLRKLNKPIVWTLHDMWPFTGGCHYAGECQKYMKQCSKCPQLNSKDYMDLSYRIFNKKLKYFTDLDLTIVVLCRWMKKCVEQSKIFRSKNIVLIPNGLDTDVYKPINKTLARKTLKLPKDKKIIAFGALNLDEKRKGFNFLKEAIYKISKMNYSHKICIVVFGASYSTNILEFPFEIRFMGRLYDDFSLALLYSAADVFVLPSLEDNLPNTLIESIACATPCVAFNTGGILDIISHKKNGYLAEYKDTDDLAKGISWVIVDEKRNEKLGKNARLKAMSEFSLKVQAHKYKKLFESLQK